MADKVNPGHERGFTRFVVCALFNPVMFLTPIQAGNRSEASGMAALLDQLAHASTRPRYAFMLLGLIAELARADGSAGPFVMCNGTAKLLRDWLCDALTPMGRRDPKRQALASRIRDEFARASHLPDDHAAAEVMIEDEIRERVRASGKTNLSRAVSELVKAGLVSRHYQGTFVDHRNRGAQRHVVYTLAGRARCLLHNTNPAAPQRTQIQNELPFNTKGSADAFVSSWICPSASPR